MNWKFILTYSDLTLEGCGMKRRLVYPSGEVLTEYELDKVFYKYEVK